MVILRFRALVFDLPHHNFSASNESAADVRANLFSTYDISAESECAVQVSATDLYAFDVRSVAASSPEALF